MFDVARDVVKSTVKMALRFGFSGILATAGCKTPQQFDIQPAPPGGTALVRLNEVLINGRPALISINCGTDPTTQTPEDQLQDMYTYLVKGGVSPNSEYPVSIMALKLSPRLASICTDK